MNDEQANTLPVEKWVIRITLAWQNQMTSIFEVGNLLQASKDEVGHGSFMEMIKHKLPFGHRTATTLMKLQSCQRITNETVRSNLPANWTILRELEKLTSEQFDHGIKTGAINPKMRTKDVRILRGESPKQGSSVKRKSRASKGQRVVVTELNSLAWSNAPVEQRQKFISSVGIKSLFEVMSEVEKAWLWEALSHSNKPPPPSLAAAALIEAIPDDLSVPKALRR